MTCPDDPLVVATIPGDQNEPAGERDTSDHGIGAPDRLSYAFQVAVDPAGMLRGDRIEREDFELWEAGEEAGDLLLAPDLAKPFDDFHHRHCRDGQRSDRRHVRQCTAANELVL